MKTTPLFFALAFTLAFQLGAADRVRTASGILEGTHTAGSKIRVFKGIPYAAPPLGDLRWKAPKPAAKWTGVRKAVDFGPRCMQGNLFSDMVFRDSGPSEDCLNLNVWTPASSAGAKLPVMVWIYGGGFTAGAASEPRQDGENLARHGVVVVSMNYRLGIFGFFSHASLASESDRNSSGNYGLMDQTAALQWVQKNIAAFGGDPRQVTIFGESAGSFSVSAQMASPLAQGLFQRAIGESGAFFGLSLSTKPHAETEQAGAKFAEYIGASSLEDLRKKPAAELLQATLQPGAIRFSPNVDGYFLPQDVKSIYAAGKQSHIPLLAGWNSDEGNYRSIFGKQEPTAANFIQWAKEHQKDRSDEFLALYSAASDEQAKRSAQDLAGDQFIAYSTWKWLEMQSATGQSAVYRYQFDDAPPTAESRGAYHSAEIEFVFGALASKNLPWRAGDHALSELMSTYWSNFAKNGDPNGSGLPKWPLYNASNQYPVMHLNAQSQVSPDDRRKRYEFLDRIK